jgi:hypothetical protein
MESHTWDQDSDEVRVWVPIASSTKAKDIEYKMAPNKLTLGIKGQAPYLDAEAGPDA